MLFTSLHFQQCSVKQTKNRTPNFSSCSFPSSMTDGSHATLSHGYTCNFLLALALTAVLRQKSKVVLSQRFCCRTCTLLHMQHAGFAAPATSQRSVVLPVRVNMSDVYLWFYKLSHNLRWYTRAQNIRKIIR